MTGFPVSIAALVDHAICEVASIFALGAMCVGRDMSGTFKRRLSASRNQIPVDAIGTRDLAVINGHLPAGIPSLFTFTHAFSRLGVNRIDPNGFQKIISSVAGSIPLTFRTVKG